MINSLDNTEILVACDIQLTDNTLDFPLLFQLVN